MDRNDSPVVASAEADRAEAKAVKRVRFDDLILEFVRLGYETYEDLTKANRARLVRLYFEETNEWGDALCDDAAPVLDAFEHHDHADLGLAIAMKMTGYVRPYIDKQLAYQALCRREREEMLA